MSKKNIFTTIAIIISFVHFSFKEKKENETKIVLKTTFGDIKFKLYNETPKHRDNFIKLVNDHFYDSTLFHRVIQSFMIQGGDPDSRKAKPNVMLGNGETGYTIPAEFVSAFYHKRGALAAARQGDDVNPTKASSGCQFYIVQGRTFTDSLLLMQEQRINGNTKQAIFNHLLSKPDYQYERIKIISFQKLDQMDSLRMLINKFQPIVEEEYAKTAPFKFSEEQRKTYTTVGGAPHLDGSYTVFGEVLEGMDVVDKIAAVQVDGMARPIQDVRVLKAYIVKK